MKSALYTHEWENELIRYEYNMRYSKFVQHFYVRNIESMGKIDWIRFLNGNDDFLRF